MTAAAVAISEFNTGSETETTSITNTNMGTSDAANLTAGTAIAITAGNNSYDKFQKFKYTKNDSTAIKNLKVWYTGTLAANTALKTNARESSYAGAHAYSTPSMTSHGTPVDQDMPSSTPSGANLGIGGSLTGELTASGYSDYLVMQIQTTGSATAGATVTMNYQYDEYS